MSNSQISTTPVDAKLDEWGKIVKSLTHNFVLNRKNKKSYAVKFYCYFKVIWYPVNQFLMTADLENNEIQPKDYAKEYLTKLVDDWTQHQSIFTDTENSDMENERIKGKVEYILPALAVAPAKAHTPVLMGENLENFKNKLKAIKAEQELDKGRDR